MEEERAIEALIAQADRLSGLPRKTVDLTLEEEAHLRPLMEVAERLKMAMVPMEPSTAFVRSLGRELMETARHQQTAARRLRRRGVVIGAAALGSALSVASVVTLILLRRRTHIPHPASG